MKPIQVIATLGGLLIVAVGAWYFYMQSNAPYEEAQGRGVPFAIGVPGSTAPAPKGPATTAPAVPTTEAAAPSAPASEADAPADDAPADDAPAP